MPSKKRVSAFKARPFRTTAVILLLGVGAYIITSLVLTQVILQRPFVPGLSGLLSPARDIDGVWKSSTPITLYYLADDCGDFERYGSIEMNMTWEISSTSDNEVQITITQKADADYEDFGVCDFYAPPIYDSEEYYSGEISSSTLKLIDDHGNEAGDFTFTTDLLEGTLEYAYCNFGFCEGWETDRKALELIKE